MRVSTYLEGQAGLNQAAQFCRATRQAPGTKDATEYPVHLLYNHIAQSLGCELVQNADEYWDWIGSREDKSYQSRWCDAVVMEMCKAHDIDYHAAMRDAQLSCKAWADATRRPGEWVRDGKGCWRFIDIRTCPDVVDVQFAEG